MADTSLDRKQRKLDQMEAELLASDQEIVIGDSAENELIHRSSNEILAPCFHFGD